MRVVYNPEYEIIFRKAETDLGLAEGTIKDLANYYDFLDKLLEQSPEYLRVPIEEGCFKINTSNRAIIKPEKLTDSKDAEWIIGVKDDHMAEVLFFEVDRYFDGQDLAVCFPKINETSHKGQTYVQWKNSLYGALDPVTYVEIQEEKIYFGWILTSGREGKSTGGPLSCAGDLTFSVRFQYHAASDQVTGQPDRYSDTLFSLNTTSITCKVAENLISSMGNNAHISNLHVENIADQARCPRFSNIFNNVLGPMPNIITPLPDHKNFEEGSDTITLKIEAVAPGNGILSYEWIKDAQPIADATTKSYVINKTDPNVTGRYTVLIGNEYEPDKIRYAQSECVIPGPSPIKFIDEQHLASDGLADGQTTLTVGVEIDPAEVVYDWDSELGELSYAWYREALDNEELDESFVNPIEGATTNSYTPPADAAGKYTVKVYHSKNGSVTEALVPSAPAIMKARAATPSSITLVHEEESNTIKAIVVMDNGHYNDLYYKWNFVPADNSPLHSQDYTLDHDTFSYYGPGLYTCQVKQEIYRNIEGGFAPAATQASEF